MSKYVAPLVVVVIILLTGLQACKKNPVVPSTIDTSHCDTCHIDTTHHPCDTCDTSHYPPNPNDTSSHAFSWMEKSIQSESLLTGCWVFGQHNIYVVGGAVWKWDGSNWKDVSPQDVRGNSLSGVLSGQSMFAFTETDYWLTHGYVNHVVAGVLTKYPFDNTVGFLHSSWGTSSSDMYSVGDGGTILHFDGTAWTKMQSGTTKDLLSVWGTSDKNIWAAGFKIQTDESVLLHFDGSVWHSVDLASVGNITPKYDVLAGVWTCDSSGHAFVAAAGSLVWRQTESGSWRRDSAGLPNAFGGGGRVTLYFTSGNGPNDFASEGSWGWIGHWNGRTWKRFDNLYDESVSDFAPGGLSMKDNTICAVGLKNGSSWIAIGQR